MNPRRGGRGVKSFKSRVGGGSGEGEAPSSVIVVCRSRIHDQVAVAVGGGGAVAVAVAGLTKRFFNHIQKDFLINVWGYADRRLVDVGNLLRWKSTSKRQYMGALYMTWVVGQECEDRRPSSSAFVRRRRRPSSSVVVRRRPF